MAKVLGIDTGGTFTDSVVVDIQNRIVLSKAKAPTTRKNLAEGIKNSLDKLPYNTVEGVSFVSLSTTLATNSVVEGRGCRVGLILTGRQIDDELPVNKFAFVESYINIKGQVQRDIDWDALEESVTDMIDSVDVIAISGFSSIRNPIHENQIKEYIRSVSDIPIVCAHELSGQLGFYERTVTSCLNAKLLPVIHELIVATKECLMAREIDVPIMVVRGDGTLMHESMALERPVETVLSGPAASVIGAKFLTDIEYAMILDMGGTTTDIANLTVGKTKINNSGATVAGWSTKVRAIDIYTFGLGGDSYIYYDNSGNIQVGPQKVTPICVLAERHPEIVEELINYRKPMGYELYQEKSTDCFSYIKEPTVEKYQGIKREVLDVLKDGPHSLFWLARHFDMDADHLGLTEMVQDGCLERASFTPTDILVAEGHLHFFNKQGADIALQIISDVGGMNKLDMVIFLKRFIYRRIARFCVQSACHFEGHDLPLEESESANYFLSIAFQGNEKGILNSEFTLKKPIIAIGAPVKAWMYNVGQYLSTTIIVPEHAEVANAVGAAVAAVEIEKEVRIRYNDVTDKYFVFTEDGREICDDYDEAKALAKKCAIEIATRMAEQAGGSDLEVSVTEEDKYTTIFTSGTKHYVETIVKAMAIGKPKWLE